MRHDLTWAAMNRPKTPSVAMQVIGAIAGAIAFYAIAVMVLA